VDDRAFQAKLNELVEEIGSIPAKERQKLIMLVNKSQKNQNKIKKSVASLQESLDYLRVTIKYMIFDLEATRRENKYLRKLLDGKDKS
jgi:nitric oxide reductase activation protein